MEENKLESINRFNQLTGFGRMFISPQDIKWDFNDEITEFEADKILIKFYSDNWKYIYDFSLNLFKEFNKINLENKSSGYSYLKLNDKNKCPQLYAVRLDEEQTFLMKLTSGKEIESVQIQIKTIDGIDDPNKNVSRKTLSINTAFRLLNMIVRNSITFSPTIGRMIRTPVYKTPINIVVTMKNGEIITTEVVGDKDIYIEPEGGNNVIDGLKYWSVCDPYLGLHYHIEQGMELGLVEGISSYSYECEVHEYMERFSDIHSMSTTKYVTNFKIVDAKYGLYLCECLESGICFIVEYFYDILNKYEDYILEKWYDFNEDIKLEDITDTMLLGMEFELETDFLAVERFENISIAKNQLLQILK